MTMAKLIREKVSAIKQKFVALRNDGITEVPTVDAIELANLAELLAQQLVKEREKTEALAGLLRKEMSGNEQR